MARLDVSAQHAQADQADVYHAGTSRAYFACVTLPSNGQGQFRINYSLLLLARQFVPKFDLYAWGHKCASAAFSICEHHPEKVRSDVRSEVQLG